MAVIRRVARPDLTALDLVLPLVFVAGGLAFGYVLVAVASRLGSLGPVAVLAIPLLPALALAVLRDLRVGVIAVIATFPVGVTEVPGSPFQLVQLTVLVVVALVALRRLAAGEGPLPLTLTMTWAVAFVAWLVLAVPSALAYQLAFRETALWIVGFLVAAAVVAACPRLSDVAIVLGALVLVITLASATAPFDTADIRAAYGGSVVKGRATGIFPEPNQMGTFAATGALVGVGLAFSAGTRRRRWLAWSGSAICLLALMLSLSRGAWIGFTVGAVVLLVKLASARRTLAAAAVPLVLIALAVGSFAPSSPQVEVVGQRLRSITGEKNPYDDRPAIWSEAFSEIRDDPWSGQGPGNFPVASTRATSASRTTFAAHAHNQLLTWASEDGLPAAAFAIGLAVAVHLRLRRAARLVPARAQGIVAGVAAALAAVAGQGLVDYTLRNSVIHTTLMVLLGCAFAIDRLTSRPDAASA